MLKGNWATVQLAKHILPRKRPVADRLEAIATRVETIAGRLEAIAIRLEAIIITSLSLFLLLFILRALTCFCSPLTL